MSLPTPPASFLGVSEPEQAAWVERRLTPHPFATSPLRLTQPVGHGLPTSYIVCTGPLCTPMAMSREWVKAHGWETMAIPTGHDAMVTAPKLLADLLEHSHILVYPVPSLDGAVEPPDRRGRTVRPAAATHHPSACSCERAEDVRRILRPAFDARVDFADRAEAVAR